MDIWSEFHALIDQALNKARPPRAKPSDKEWQAPVIGLAANKMPDESMLLRRFAEQVVSQRDALATKHAKKIMKDYVRGIVPLDWSMFGPLPIDVGGLRVRLDVATPNDVEDAARETERRARLSYQSALAVVDGFRDIARDARDRGFPLVHLIGDQPLRDGEREAVFAAADDDEDDDEDE
jgi:hypothetical protein